jgi:predicted nucleic acid-binding Zn finger protein
VPPEDWRAELESAGELTPPVVEAILRDHGDRGQRAIDAVGEGRVKGYNDFTVVVGHAEEYIVENGGCTCKDAGIGAVDRHDMFYSEVRDLL